MERQFESVGQKLAHHRHLLLQVGPDFTWWFGKNIVMVGLDPRRAAGDRPGSKVVGRLHQGLQRMILGEKLMTLHHNVPAFEVRLRRLDRRHFKRIEFRAHGRRLREHYTRRKKRNRNELPHRCIVILTDETPIRPARLLKRVKSASEMIQPAALGFRAHSGWAVVVTVGGSALDPVLLDRRRIEIADPAVPGSKQPFHTAEQLPFEQAETLIDVCRTSSTALAKRAVTAVVADIERQGHRIAGAGLLCGSGRALPGLAATLQSHALIHTAEGEFFRDALERASESCSLPVAKIKERALWDRSAEMFHLSAANLQRRIDGLGRTLGPPWRQDEKLSALVAWIVLAEYCRQARDIG
jgi:hypothetical protein